MGFGTKLAQEAALDSARQAAAEVRAMEQGGDNDDAPSSSAPAAPAPTTSRPNIFGASAQRPSFAAPAASAPAQAAPLAPATSRPSFGPPAAKAAEGPSTPAASGRPSFGPPASGNAANAARPSLTPPPASQAKPAMPDARAVFVRNQSRQEDGAPAQARASYPSQQALFEIVCTHRKMSPSAIEAARSQAVKNPEGVMAQMRRIYDQEVAPNRSKHATDLPQALADHPEKVVFLLRKDSLERVRMMSREDAIQSGEILLHGASIESVQAASSPFDAPSTLFAAPELPAEPEAVQEEVVTAPVRSSPKP